VTQRDPGSFRDPAGRVLHLDGKVYRVVTPAGAAAFKAARDSGLLAQLVQDGLLVPWSEVAPPAALDAARLMDVPVAHVLEHPRLDFISYPYEWPFTALQAAALLHLDVQLRALARGMALSDATAYNVQFDGPRPVFIDHGSFRPYREGEFWLGHRQFCDQFLNPLLLTARCGLPFHAWYRAGLDGIPGPQLNALLPWYRKLAPLVLLHVTLPALMQARSGSAAAAARPRQPRLPLAAFRNLLTGLRDGIAALRPPRSASAWSGYAGNTVYQPQEARLKHDFVRAFVGDARPATVWDLGCNTGDYAVTCLQAGVRRVIGFEGDAATADLAFARARRERLALLPLVMNLANPSPSQGWRETERGGLARRTPPDAMLALALLHHLVIQNNVPLADAVEWLVSLAPAGVIEFVPKADPMVQRLLALREDIFPDYTRERFLELLAQRAKVTAQAQVTAEGRLLVSYARAPA
jgi:ribosomal protein L11 methylase PrmA